MERMTDCGLPYPKCYKHHTFPTLEAQGKGKGRKGKETEKEGENIVRAEAQDTCGGVVSSVDDREGASMKS